MSLFDLKTDFTPQGDQPQAIEALNRGLDEGKSHQCLLGVTGSGKTFTMANVIQNVQRPTLVMSHNKTLAAQLYSEFKEFFPHNAISTSKRTPRSMMKSTGCDWPQPAAW